MEYKTAQKARYGSRRLKLLPGLPIREFPAKTVFSPEPNLSPTSVPEFEQLSLPFPGGSKAGHAGFDPFAGPLFFLSVVNVPERFFRPQRHKKYAVQ